MFTSMSDVMKANAALGHNWFSKGAMEFFDSRIESVFYPKTGDDKIVGYFVHSRQFHGSDGTSAPRTFHVAGVAPNGSVNPGGEAFSPFPDGYADLASALLRINQLLQ